MAEGEKLEICKVSKYPENLTLVILPTRRSPPGGVTMPIYETYDENFAISDETEAKIRKF